MFLSANNISFTSRFKTWLVEDVKPFLTSSMFRFSFAMFLGLGLIVGGFVESFAYKSRVAYHLAMTVSPSNTTSRFAVSGTEITFKEQFRSGSTFILPFEIKSLESVPVLAHEYSVQLQGVMQEIPLDNQARLVLFGRTGRGAIVVDGSFDGYPMNVYLMTNKILGAFQKNARGDLKPGDISLSQALGREGQQEAGNNPLGFLTMDGHEIPVWFDVVYTRVNPNADNIIQTDKPINFDSTPSEIYAQTFGKVEKYAIHTNRERTEEVKASLRPHLIEYEERLLSDPNLSESRKNAVLEADRIAMDSYGKAEDRVAMNQLLRDAGLKPDGGVELEDGAEINADNIDQIAEREVDLSNFGARDGVYVDPLKRLQEIRDAYIALNKKLRAYQLQEVAVENMIKEFDGTSSSAVQYQIVTPFKFN